MPIVVLERRVCVNIVLHWAAAASVHPLSTKLSAVDSGTVFEDVTQRE